MATAIVRHRVSNFSTWKATFDNVEDVRRADGMTGWNIYTAANDDLEVTAVLEFSSLEKAQGHFSNPVVKQAMQNAGVISKPEVTFLEAR